MKIEIHQDIIGSILDIGGGGECLIGQIFGNQVIAIDNSQEELDEAPDCCEKRLMDATQLQFSDNIFNNVTFFYSLMYMNNKVQRKALQEAIRVLKPGGKCYIWDTDIESAYPNPFFVDLDINSDRISVHTSYGILKDEAQNMDTILEFLNDFGLSSPYIEKNGTHFFITCEKL